MLAIMPLAVEHTSEVSLAGSDINAFILAMYVSVGEVLTQPDSLATVTVSEAPIVTTDPFFQPGERQSTADKLEALGLAQK